MQKRDSWLSLLTYLPHSPVSEQPAPPPSSSHYTVKTSLVILSLRRVGRVAPWVGPLLSLLKLIPGQLYNALNITASALGPQVSQAGITKSTPMALLPPPQLSLNSTQGVLFVFIWERASLQSPKIESKIQLPYFQLCPLHISNLTSFITLTPTIKPCWPPLLLKTFRVFGVLRTILVLCPL